MARHQKNLGERRHERIELRRGGFVFFAPDAPWFACNVLDISEGGARLDVGDLVVPPMFGLVLSNNGSVLRVCVAAWRQGGVLGARFVSARELREQFAGVQPAERASSL